MNPSRKNFLKLHTFIPIILIANFQRKRFEEKFSLQGFGNRIDDALVSIFPGTYVAKSISHTRKLTSASDSCLEIVNEGDHISEKVRNRKNPTSDYAAERGRA